MAWKTGYYYGSGFGGASVPFSQYTHVLYESISPNGGSGIDTSPANLSELDSFVASAHAAGAKALVCLGVATASAWQGSTNSGNIAGFVSAVASFVSAHNLDGVDLDWESGIIDSQYADCIQRLRSALGSSKTITMAAYGGGTGNPKHAAVLAGPSNLDQINMMTYDMDIYEAQTWFETAVLKGPDNRTSIQTAFEEFVAAGIPASKLGIGIPFYGSQYNGASGPNQSRSYGGFIAYSNINPAGAVVNGTYQGTGVASNPWVTFVGTAEIADIVAYGTSVGIGGYMTFPINWEDAGNTLSSALASGGGSGGGGSAPSLPVLPSGYSLSHGDDFSGGSLPAGWNLGYYFSNTVPSSAVTASGGALHLTWTRGGVSDISVSSSATYHYGYFEARMKWNPTTGAWPAFWMIPTSGIQHTGEIDVFEGQGDDPGGYFATLHEWNGSSQIWQSSPNRFGVSVDWTQYHNYGLLWEPGGKFTWFLDGAVINVITGAPSIFDTQSVFLILSMQEGANWSVGNLAGVSASTLTLDVESVNVYTSGTAAPGSPVIASFGASPTSVNPGATATLSWSVTGADSLSIDQGVGPVTGSSTTVPVSASTFYTLTATNTNGTVTASASVSITGTSGGSGSSGGTASTGSGGGTTGTGTTTNTGGFTVGSIPPPVINSFTPSSGTITAGSSATLSFSTSGATANFIDGVPVTGSSLSVSPTTTTTFVLSAVNSGGTTTQEVTIIVHGARAEAIRYHQIREDDREGDGHEFQMSAPANPAINGYPAVYTTHENVIARQPRGNTTAVQMADQTGGYTEGDLVDFDRFGNTRDSGIKKSTVLTTIGGSGTTAGLAAVGYGSWVGQVPRGVVNGSNRSFRLDYKLLNWYTVLNIGRDIQMPGVQNDPNHPPFGVMAVPGGEYAVELAQNYLLTARAPQSGEDFYIEYWRADPASVATGVVLTITTAYSNPGGVGAVANVSIYGTSFSFGGLPWIFTATPYAKTTQSIDVSVSLLPVQLTEQAGIDEFNLYFYTLGGGASFTVDLDIYDAFLTVTYADTSTQIYRPTSFITPADAALSHMEEAPPTYANAYSIDGDPNTFARYVGTHFGSLSSPTPFILTGWSIAGSTPGPTPVGPNLPPVSSTSVDTTLPAGSTGQVVNVTSSTPTTITLPSVIAAPSAPAVATTSGGPLGATTPIFVRITYVNTTGETSASPESTLKVGPNQTLTVTSPAPADGATGFNVFVGTTSGGETKQNLAAIPIGTDFTMSTSGLVTSAILPPTINTATPSSTFSNIIGNTGTGTVTIAAPTGVALNGITGGTFTVSPDTAALVLFNPTTGFSAIPLSGGTTTGTGATTPLLDSGGTPILDSHGNWIFPG